MKLLLVVTLVATALPAFAYTQDGSSRPAKTKTDKTTSTATHDPPLACNPSALTPEIRKRHFEELGPKLVSLRKKVRELSNGYEFEFPADATTYQMVTEWAIQERLCCPFFDIEIRMERTGGPIWMRLTGGKGVKEFMQIDAAKWIKM